MNVNVNENSRNGIQVIARAASILRLLKDHPDGLSLGQIAAEVDLPRSTVQRISGALQVERLLIANTSGGGVRLGPELGALAEAVSYNTVEQCHALLAALTDATGETSDLSVLRDGKMIFVDQVSGTHRLRTISSVGEEFPLAKTANGRACLAMLPRNDAMQLALSEASQASTELDIVALGESLDEIQNLGLAYDIDEHAEGISAIGFAFEDLAGELHAISVPVPSSRFLRQKATIEKALRQTSEKLEKILQTDQ